MTPEAFSAPPREPVSLLVVEDSEDDYALLLGRVRDAGMGVVAHRVDTPAALRGALAAGACHAVIADEGVDGLPALEALAIVREFDPDTPFVVVSAAAGEDAAADAMRAGADDYLSKDRLGLLEPTLARVVATAATRRSHRHIERAAAESEARFRALSANLPGMVFQVECVASSRSLVYASEGSRRLFGAPPEALLGDVTCWFGLFDPVERDRLTTLFTGPHASGGDGERLWLEHTALLRSADSERVRWIEFTARARRLGSDRMVWDGIASDITPQREAEAALRRSREELRELASYLARVREEERAAIARELHDDVGSTLTGVKFQLVGLKSQVAHDPVLTAKIVHFEELIEGVVGSTSRLVHDLRPGILDEGIVAALEWQARTFRHRAGVTCTFETTHEDIALPAEASIAVFRICQEALNNVAKHARATAAHVRIAASDFDLVLEVRDDGVGLGTIPVDERGHFGLRGMRERAHALGGTIAFFGSAAEGTTITLKLPRAAAMAGAQAGDPS